MGHFVDRCKAWLRAGDGGDGCSSFRREKFIPKGGPDGGDGGKGGNISVVAVEGLYTLWQHCLSPHKIAERGKSGSGKKCHGAKGKDLIIQVPVGTQILSSDQSRVLVDLTESGKFFVLARGGQGGLGNTRFKSSINRAPRFCTKGSPGEGFWAWLQVKLIVDVGLVGLPNAGKSSLLKKLTRATPKVANYPFTTLDPQLGILEDCSDHKIVVVDIPGLVEGAWQGKGLGRYFLRHVERCNLLMQIIDVNNNNLRNDYLIIRQELNKYQADLDQRQHVLVLNKIDLLVAEERKNKLRELKKWCKVPIITVSGLTGENIPSLRQYIINNFINRHNLSKDKTLNKRLLAQDVNNNNNTKDNNKAWSPW